MTASALDVRWRHGPVDRVRDRLIGW
jgi:hypothetical protein